MDGWLMKMTEVESVYLRVKEGRELHLANNAKYCRILEQIY